MLDAPLKRMALLERRKQDDRAFFSRHWRDVHGGMVSRLPFLTAYMQNHVVEDFPHEQAHFPGDGFVEQLWRSTAEMQRGYSSEVVKELVADEVNYLGHGSNYAILASEMLRPAPDGSKVIIAIRHGGEVGLVDEIMGACADLATHCVRDDVIATIPKPNMLPAQPHPIDAFLHCYCAGPDRAEGVGAILVERMPRLSLNAAVGIWRVRTEVII